MSSSPEIVVIVLRGSFSSCFSGGGFGSRQAALRVFALGIWLFALTDFAQAASGTIVALGTSNTRGRGVPLSESYPAQLEATIAVDADRPAVATRQTGANGSRQAGSHRAQARRVH